MYKRCIGFIKLMRVHQPVGFFLLLWPTLWALWITNRGIPDFIVLSLFIVGVMCMRSAGCVINDYIDYDIDMCVQRTIRRPIVIGSVKKQEALWVFFILILIALIVVCVFNNIIAVFLSLIVLGLSIIYPYLKRYIYLPQLVLGIIFSWSILIVYTVMNCAVNKTTWLLFLANTIWVVLYDTEYAMVDRDDDKCIGIKSSALLFGKIDKIVIGILQLLTVFILYIIGIVEQLPIIFYLFSIVGASILFIWQQVLIFNRNREKCLWAFLSNSYVGMLIFVGIVLSF
ncbi:4-hydroxybenzoate octaprenyl transferase [Candidatus Blochmanniella floridana]|uniref:4-hydroxybenzoate octaprenyltransferase n=1 Tax=Blochmanniella floridana TaxID=203907 RepID=UBIA_BLOFL|nr:RecName: Full=4-hydroxybenzoate octaprenyltransferase; AltName: Full=4-HB polyprenyltransferase [Candidatus Blochmannia floridanus]CAD83553.1 4-hydroxybenzoate octaprenyl transferase [Candidatus Blochmannia floridanus]